ncbi:Conserved_hypothetical protein [Hexamita inflata]|uniref:Uncharacterized protein n=1 Tax=Hexamita inflata TaxID=28002 RepID=A0AA86R1B0_9EUKA|nr:Conserved hypothetical protein [Hexamita inflata]
MTTEKAPKVLFVPTTEEKLAHDLAFEYYDTDIKACRLCQIQFKVVFTLVRPKDHQKMAHILKHHLKKEGRGVYCIKINTMLQSYQPPVQPWHNGVWIASQLKIKIEMLRQDHNIIVTCCCQDSAQCNVKAIKLLNGESKDYKDLTSEDIRNTKLSQGKVVMSRCTAHIMNLILKDYIKQFDSKKWIDDIAYILQQLLNQKEIILMSHKFKNLWIHLKMDSQGWKTIMDYQKELSSPKISQRKGKQVILIVI